MAPQGGKKTGIAVKSFFNIAGIIFLHLDHQGSVIHINRIGAKILGYPIKDIVGKNWFDHFIPKPIRDEIRDVHRQLFRGSIQPVDQHENPVLTGKGKERLIAWHNTVLRDGKGKITGTLSAGEDITSRKRMERELRQNQEFLNSILESIQDGISVLDPDLTIRHTNRVMEKWYADRLPLVGRKCHEVYQQRRRPCQPCPTVRCLKTGRTERDIVPGVPGSGIEWIELFSYPIRDPQTRKITGVAEFVRDITHRKNTEDALKNSEEKLRDILDHSTNLFYRHTPDHKLTYVSPQSRKYLQCEPDEAMIRWTEFVTDHPLNREGFAVTQKAIKTGKRQPPYPLQLKGKKGRITWVEVREAPIVVKGETVAITGSLTDITERQKTEDALRKSEKTYRTYFKTVRDAVFITSPDGRWLDFNDAAVTLFGYDSPEDLQKVKIRDLYADPRDRQKHLDLIRKEGFVKENPVDLRKKDGTVIHTLITTVPARDEEGKITAYQGTIRDITRQKRAEEALRESEGKYRSLYSSIRDAILIADMDRNIIDCNPAFTRLFGYRREDLQGLKTRSVYANDKDFKDLGKALRAHDPDRPFLKTVRYRKKNGETFPGETSVYSITQKNDQITGFIGLIRDVSKQRKTEAQLRQAQKMEAIGQLAGGVAHDFNNLLTVIQGFCEILLEKKPREDADHEELTQIRQAGERAADLVQQLLAFSRRQMINPRVLDTNFQLRNIRTMLQRVLGEDIELKTVAGRDLYPIRMDPVQLEQVIMNLAINARDAMPRGGRLTISTARTHLDDEFTRLHPGSAAGPHTLIEVTDTGQGMIREVRERIFEPFYTTKKRGRGTGMGLATVFGIVKQSNGYISVQSEPGRGSTFRVYLPATAEAPVPVTEKPSPAEVPNGTETILVVEDESSVLRLVEQGLQRSGYRLILAATGREALIKAESHQGIIDLLLTDVVMPGMSGPDLSKAIRKRYPDIRICYMSGYSRDVTGRHGIVGKEVNFIQKPFSQKDLNRKIRKILDRETSGS